MVPNEGVLAVSLPMNNPAVIVSPAQLALPGGNGIRIKEIVPPGSSHTVEVYTDDVAQMIEQGI